MAKWPDGHMSGEYSSLAAMEISDVRRQVLATIDRAKRQAASHRELADEATREYTPFLESVALPLFRQVANVLRSHGYPFTVFTPGGSVRLMSDRSSDDFIELSLDTAGERPAVIGHSRRARGSRTIDTETAISDGAVRDISEDQLRQIEEEGLDNEWPPLCEAAPNSL